MENVYANYTHRDANLQLHKLSDDGLRNNLMEEKYEAEIRKLNREMQAYRNTITKLTAKHDGYNHVIQLFESKLQLMAKHVENLQNKSQLKISREILHKVLQIK
ncbi:unnamed protein product [Onchocerca flexuosa]|uniref:TACC_C domain-containing protein n=1 Tax=Onchocerca flexuosa TaxID=387005 RepID=A0A183I6Q9_9BILA|nr:unnamed protein product [Onchocerca flexuosa]